MSTPMVEKPLVVIVTVAESVIALPSENVVEIIQRPGVGWSDPFPFRGDSLPLVGLGKVLGLSNEVDDPEQGMVISRERGGGERLLLTVEKVNKIEDLAGGEWYPFPSTVELSKSGAYRGVIRFGKDLFLALNPEILFNGGDREAGDDGSVGDGRSGGR